MLSEGLVAIDNGGYSTCVATKSGVFSFPSSKGLYKKRTLESTHGNFDYVLEFNGEKFLMGTLASESKFPLQMHTLTKANNFYDLSVYMSLALVGYDINKIIVSVPISQHTEHEKTEIVHRLLGPKEVILNGKLFNFHINEVKIAPETVTAFWCDRPLGKTRWIDWGSRTIGYGTTIYEGKDLKFLDKESGTFEKFGIDAKRLEEVEEHSLADYVGGMLTALWDKEDQVFHIGGGVNRTGVMERMKTYFKNSEISDEADLVLVKGMYILGRGVMGID
jgi:hypothetical protein